MAGIDIAGITANAVVIAFGLVDGVLKTATLHLATTKTYTWATDSSSESGTPVTAKGLFYDASQKQRETTGNIAYFLIKGTDAPTIDESDTADIDSATWQIHDVQSVPGKAVFILGLRK